eukprot:gnl/TRDRNA2_/TRDRNA2_41596_c0_seq1.p1 gnl/TRDRNA2_/TRDRNA2_41596_c0~~gnl/TRDRNA2_/TRDRNA2_41596_c0_seq1.p1  ORF type:complete len:336 (-),score=27.99 gnl/TRDRNA2_/TRDRNA2_41596_c0_seq1:173-1180(-)
MLDTSLAFVEPLQQKAVPCRAYCYKTALTLLSLFISLGLAVLLSPVLRIHAGGGQHLTIHEPTITLATRVAPAPCLQCRADEVPSSPKARRHHSYRSMWASSLPLSMPSSRFGLRRAHSSVMGTFSPSAPILKKQRRVHALCAATAAEGIDVAEMAKIFGRLAEDVIYLDNSVGVCCHKDCSNCEWFLPDGSYYPPIAEAKQPTWIPCYTENDFSLGNRGRRLRRGCHRPQWPEMFAAGPLTEDTFPNALKALQFSMPAGPPVALEGQPEPSEQVLARLWEVSTATAAQLKDVEVSAITSLTPEDFVAVLQEWSSQKDFPTDFVTWEDFETAMCG